MQRRVSRRVAQHRLFSKTARTLDPNYRSGEWQPQLYSSNSGRSLINGSTTLYDFMIYQFRLNRFRATMEGRVANFLEYTQKNIGLVSMRSKAFNYSLYYYFGTIHKSASNLLFNVRLQPVMMHKVHHLIQYFHAGQSLQYKSIIRKPANFRYFWLWWLTRRNFSQAHYLYDQYVYARKCYNGEVKLPQMKITKEGWRQRILNAFEGK